MKTEQVPGEQPRSPAAAHIVDNLIISVIVAAHAGLFLIEAAYHAACAIRGDRAFCQDLGAVPRGWTARCFEKGAKFPHARRAETEGAP